MSLRTEVEACLHDIRECGKRLAAQGCPTGSLMGVVEQLGELRRKISEEISG